MQLVLSNNRVLAHGENFLSVGSVVINTDTGIKYENATIAECENCPSDIGEVGYEYHAGVFKPCAPYGVGNGNVAVVCNRDCKSLKDSGVPFGRMGQVVETSYEGIDGDTIELTFDAIPVIVFITTLIDNGGSNSWKEHGFAYDGVCYRYHNGNERHIIERDDNSSAYVCVNGTTLEIRDSQSVPFNRGGVKYKIIAILQGGE